MTQLDRPQFSDIDAYGVTHTGNVRSENADHFFVGALARGVTTVLVAPGPDATWGGRPAAVKLTSPARVLDANPGVLATVGYRIYGFNNERLAVTLIHGTTTIHTLTMKYLIDGEITKTA